MADEDDRFGVDGGAVVALAEGGGEGLQDGGLDAELVLEAVNFRRGAYAKAVVEEDGVAACNGVLDEVVLRGFVEGIPVASIKSEAMCGKQDSLRILV